MDVTRLGLLRELAERGTVTAVARAMHLTPSAVSQQLKALEREAGVPLTERSGRGLVLTGPGRVLAETAKDVAVAIEQAEAVWADFVEQPRGEVTVTVFPSVGQMLLPGALHRVADVAGLSVVCSDQDPLLPDFADLTHDHDIVVADAPGVLPGWRERSLVITELMREPLDIALPEGHPLRRHAELTPADVIGERWIGVPDEPAVRPHPAAHRGHHRPAGRCRAALHRQRHRRVDGRRRPRHRDPAALHDARSRERARHSAARRASAPSA